ncbi:hypothetical protein [Calothrix sp. UHCC 0171]|uniref:hypothetical protein n=1 Tax=Calothrix sp. UHCC 0171 TaxID=3110245 RepID=UPI002B20B00F|nr:hypothetical protein [Calothrix sp. UHCC 0171]MEA5570085.1 hypothetical protein [Calothrix sp. UHCC 0171]
MNEATTKINQEESPERLNEYFGLIDKLITCPNGEEPQVIEAHPELLDAGLIRTMLKVAAIFVHEDNQEGAEFLVYVARELSKQLGLYPDVSAKE